MKTPPSRYARDYHADARDFAVLTLVCQSCGGAFAGHARRGVCRACLGDHDTPATERPASRAQRLRAAYVAILATTAGRAHGP